MRPMPVFDAGVYHAREKIDAGEKAQRSVSGHIQDRANALMAQGAGGKSGTAAVAIACTPGFLVDEGDDRHRRSLPGLLRAARVARRRARLRDAPSSELLCISWGIAEVLGFAAGEADNELSALRR